jgi:hypothetical protein
MDEDNIEATREDERGQSFVEKFLRMEAILARLDLDVIDPEMLEMLANMRRQLADLRASQMIRYSLAYDNARLRMEIGEMPDLIETQALETFLAGQSERQYDDPLLRPWRAGIQDAIAGREARTEFDPAWELTPREVDEIP